MFVSESYICHAVILQRDLKCQQNLAIHSYGPFSSPATLEIDDKLTILTGQNDVGKSGILRLIKLMCEDEPASLDDVNVNHLMEIDTPWSSDRETSCTATFVTSAGHQNYLAGSDIYVGDEVDIHTSLVFAKKKAVQFRRGGGEYNPNTRSIHRLPRVLLLPLIHEVGSTIDPTEANPIEQDFLELAFGNNSTVKLKDLPGSRFNWMIDEANKKLNEELKKLLPYSLGMTLRLAPDPDDRSKFTIGFQDRHDANTPVHLRGTGVRKIVTLMVALTKVNLASEYLYILYDEPENSLHADAQHMLRALLEHLASKENIQVIYATHSPSMINSFDPRGLRLLERTITNGKPTTIINNKPYQDNFFLVRNHLGMSPSDSLLYAPISIIVEGPTEILSICYLLKRLYEEKIDGFEQMPQILALTHFVDGTGSSFEIWARFAKSQGAKPIIFVDGDKIRELKQPSMQKKLRGVAVVHLEEGKEFEDIVPKEIYFKALIGSTRIEQAYEDYVTWEKEANLPEKMMFTKRVNRWIEDNFDFELDKPVVMRKALEIAEVKDIQIDKFRELVNTILELLK